MVAFFNIKKTCITNNGLSLSLIGLSLRLTLEDVNDDFLSTSDRGRGYKTYI